MQAIKRAAGVTAAHLWRRAQDVEPRLGSVRVLFKRYRGPKIQEKRVEVSKALFQRSPKDLMSATYVDEATIHIRKPPVTKGIALKGEHLISEIPLEIAAGIPDLYLIHTDCKNQNSAFLEQKLASLVRGLAIRCVMSAMAKCLQRHQVTGSIATLAFARKSSDHNIILHRLSPSF